MQVAVNKTKWFFYTFLGLMADTIDIVLASVTMASHRRPQRSVAPSDVDQLSDEAILELVKNAPEVAPTYFVFKLTPNTVAKERQDISDNVDATEANVLELLFAKTTIPVPRVRRVVDCWIVMDYIPGSTLAEIWPSLSIWRKISIAFTLRRYIRQLRRLKASAMTPPGPLSTQGPQICESPTFGALHSSRGPFASYSELSKFFNERRQMIANIRKISPEDPKRNEAFDDSEPLVLTHQDLNLRNIILGEDGRLWMIDWAWAGYYPVWFEYMTMQLQYEYEHIGRTNTRDKLWKVLIPFICGPYFKQESWWNWTAGGLYYL